MAVELVFTGNPNAARWDGIASALCGLGRVLLAVLKKIFFRIFRRRARVAH